MMGKRRKKGKGKAVIESGKKKWTEEEMERCLEKEKEKEGMREREREREKSRTSQKKQPRNLATARYF